MNNTEDKDMYSFESDAKNQGYKIICGIDEAGRGPLAGPVCAAAVVLDDDNIIEGLNDSKKLTPKKRDKLFDEIISKAKFYGIGWASVEEIEQINILQATFLAMRRAYSDLGTKADFVMVDGNADPTLDALTKTIVSGDALSASIAAASILAKVSRDRYMISLAEKYPQYGFEKHKGYGTKMHVSAILECGVTPVHRMSFLKKILAKAK